MFCTKCGKELKEDAKFCDACGAANDGVELSSSVGETTVSESNPQKETIVREKKSKKKVLVIGLIAIAIVVAIASFVGIIAGTSLNDDEQLAYQNALAMKNMLKNPDSFKLYDEMFLLKRYNDDGSLFYTYTIFEYGGTNGYGAMITSEAVFKDGTYLMDYADEPDEEDANYIDQQFFKMDISLFKLSEDDTWDLVEIDVKKIKRKMGIE